MKIVFAAALTCGILLTADVASAQRLRDTISSRLGVRNGANAALQEDLAAEAVFASQQTFGKTQAPTTTPQPQAAPAATSTSGQPAAPAPKKSDGSEFIIPANATPKALIAQAESLLATEMAFESEEEYDAWLAKMLATVTKIADQVLKTPNLDDKSFVDALSLKGQALCYQASIDSVNYLAKLGAYTDALSKNKRVQSSEEGRNAALAFKGVYLQARVASVAENEKGTEQELLAAMKDVSDFVAQHPETSDMTVDLVYPIAVIAANLNNPKLPEKIWTPIRQQLAALDAPEAKNALQLLEGAIRKSQLEGSKFEWKGCDLEGKPFDTSLVEGRVVVVDFWASWNESCANTHTELSKLYARYVSDGLEIVSYSLDDKIADTQTYVKQNKIPWLILSDRATVDAKETSLAAYYGIDEIPTLILIGGDGKVAAVDISVESLAATLDSVFATAEQQAATNGASNAAANTTQTNAANGKTAGAATTAPQTNATNGRAAGAATNAPQTNAPQTNATNGRATGAATNATQTNATNGRAAGAATNAIQTNATNGRASGAATNALRNRPR